MELDVRREQFPVDGVFTIARGSRQQAHVLTVELRRGGQRGRGECVPYARYGESLDSVQSAIESQRGALSKGLDRETLQSALPAGAARNAIDCALWDLEAREAGVPVWQLAQLSEPEAVTSAYTLSLDTPDAMRAQARQHRWRPLLKVKLGGEGDLQRLDAVRDGAPEARLIVDANEGWTLDDYDALIPRLQALNVALVEQPFPVDADAALQTRDRRPVPVCADESCHDRASLKAIDGKYDVVNIKLDKTGGLTEALLLRDAARRRGCGVMVGCMLSTSLSMAPALLVAQGADFVDLDGPLLLASDRHPAMRFDGSCLFPSDSRLWG